MTWDLCPTAFLLWLTLFPWALIHHDMIFAPCNFYLSAAIPCRLSLLILSEQDAKQINSPAGSKFTTWVTYRKVTYHINYPE